MVSTQRDWYMVSSLMRKHVEPLRSGRAAGSDGAALHSAQFRKLHTPEMEPEVNSQESTFIVRDTGQQIVPREGN